MDYMDVPKSVLDLAVKVSKAAKAEYWACDVAYGKDGKVRILECATAFAAFPYIRDWIGQYLMWSLSEKRFRKPHIPMFNWEELGKIDSSLLRTMRHITFGQYNPSYDGAYFGKKKKLYGKKKVYLHQLDKTYKMYDVKERFYEEWPSEKWNYQDRFALKSLKSMKTNNKKQIDQASVCKDEAQESAHNNISKDELSEILKIVDGIGNKKVKKIYKTFTKNETIDILDNQPELLIHVKGFTASIIDNVTKIWKKYRESNS
jgi:hypothetical protein